MKFRRSTTLQKVALGTFLSLGMSLTAGAQDFAAGDPPYTPAKDAKDLKSVLYNWTAHMGMLRGVDEHELIASLEYQGNGTVQIDGQPCNAAKYRVSTNYQVPGQRTQYSCKRANGQEYSAVEVVSGPYAWNEDKVGAELVPGEGKATPAPRFVQERLIRLWAGPQGAAKAALAGTGQPDPNVLPDDGKTTVGATSVAWEGSRPVITFPIPGVPGATATATLDDRFMAERVVVKNGSTTTEFSYGDYQDWNNPLNKVEAFYAGKITERRNGNVVRDITTTETETGSVYVVTPVPPSVKAAIKVNGEPVPALTVAVNFQPPPAPQGETPRLADGKPDLTGNWNGAGMNWRYGNRRCGPTQTDDCTPAWNQTMDFEFEAPSRFGPNRPVYKPEHWDKVIALDQWTNKEDPVMTCQPLGIPRQGPPRRMIHSESDLVMFYGQYADGGGGYGEYRIVPTDGRKVEEQDRIQTKYMGATVGHWDGDTLVLESVGFNDYTWIARGGFFHSDQMSVTEKFTREGDRVRYDVTVTDPVVLVEPWVMTTRYLTASKNADSGLLPERGNCEVYELEDIETQIRH